MIIALSGAYLASIGNVVGSCNAKSGVPVTQANVYGNLIVLTPAETPAKVFHKIGTGR